MQFISQVKVNGVWRTVIDVKTHRPYRFTTLEQAEQFRLPEFDAWKALNDQRAPKVRGVFQPEEEST